MVKAKRETGLRKKFNDGKLTMNKDSKNKRNSLQTSMTMSKISQALTEERDWQAGYGKGIVDEGG